MTPSEFKAIFTEFAAKSDDAVQFFLTQAENHVDEATWGDLFEEGVMYYTAHQLKMRDDEAAGNTAAGSIASKSAGGVSISYSGAVQASSATNPFNSTSYGRQYVYLARQAGRGAVAV